MNLKDVVFNKVQDIMKRREEVIEAFIAKYGCQPDEIVLCECPSKGEFWVRKKTEWISVKDRLPEINEYVLFANEYYIDVGSRNERDELYCMGAHMTKRMPTHWMPLPEKPE